MTLGIRVHQPIDRRWHVPGLRRLRLDLGPGILVSVLGQSRDKTRQALVVTSEPDAVLAPCGGELQRVRVVVDRLGVSDLRVLGPGLGSSTVPHDEMRNREEFCNRLGALGNCSHRDCRSLPSTVPHVNADPRSVGESRIERIVLFLKPDVDAEESSYTGVAWGNVRRLSVSNDNRRPGHLRVLTPGTIGQRLDVGRESRYRGGVYIMLHEAGDLRKWSVLPTISTLTRRTRDQALDFGSVEYHEYRNVPSVVRWIWGLPHDVLCIGRIGNHFDGYRAGSDVLASGVLPGPTRGCTVPHVIELTAHYEQRPVPNS